MIKNQAGQRIGAQMLATDGSAFTGAVTVYVTGDAGTQTIGSVGSGACVHEGNGYHTYAPSQAETNYDLAAFTFIGSGAAPSTVQVYTRTTELQTDVDAIKLVTDKLDTTLEPATGSPGESRFTEDALRNAPVASDGATASVIADAVRSELTPELVLIGDIDERGSDSIVRGTVGAGTTPSTTQFTPSALGVSGVDADQFKGRIIIFDTDTATAALRGQATDITASSAASLPLLTFSALSRAPASGDTFQIV